VERVEVRNGLDTIAVLRPYGAGDLGRRIRVVWSGAEYRGRFRMTPWDGRAVLGDNAFETATGINFFNKDRALTRVGDAELSWISVTTGNFSGFDALLHDRQSGVLRVETKQGTVTVAVADIGLEPKTFDFGGLGRKLQIYRLPDENPHRRFVAEREIPLAAGYDNPLHVCVTTEDGHQAWSSPIYVVPKPDWM
jgi:hypothetical protein